MSRSDISLPQARRFAQTSRRDGWWIQPLLTFLGLGGFVVYATWRAAMNADFIYGSLLSPFYSPYLIGDSEHAWFRVAVDWKRYWPITPALLILVFPGGFRFTCYYYRGAYYKAFWADPPACAVGEPRKGYRGEAKFPLIMQNLHRYFLYFAIIFIGILAFDFGKSLFWFQADGSRLFSLHVGSIVMLLNVVFLGGYTFSCHSFRHLVGGGLDVLAGRPVRRKVYDCVTCINQRHMVWAWMSLFWVAFTDLYVFLVARGVWTDYIILGAKAWSAEIL
jgi:hypothetical protein